MYTKLIRHFLRQAFYNNHHYLQSSTHFTKVDWDSGFYRWRSICPTPLCHGLDSNSWPYASESSTLPTEPEYQQMGPSYCHGIDAIYSKLNESGNLNINHFIWMKSYNYQKLQRKKPLKGNWRMKEFLIKALTSNMSPKSHASSFYWLNLSTFSYQAMCSPYYVMRQTLWCKV